MRLWFGQHVIAEYLADSDRADHYAREIERRFAGLRVECIRAGVDHEQPPSLPEEWLWTLPPR